MWQPAWYRWTEKKLASVSGLVYLVAAAGIGIWIALLLGALAGKKVKTLLLVYTVYMVSP